MKNGLLEKFKKQSTQLVSKLKKNKWLSLLAVVAMFAGLFQDMIKPIFLSTNNRELIEILEIKQENINRKFEEIYRLNSEILFDSLVTGNFKEEVKNQNEKIKLINSELEVLFESELKAIKDNKLILARQIQHEINDIPRKHSFNNNSIERFRDSLENESLSNLWVLNHEFEKQNSRINAIIKTIIGTIDEVEMLTEEYYFDIIDYENPKKLEPIEKQ